MRKSWHKSYISVMHYDSERIDSIEKTCIIQIQPLPFDSKRNIIVEWIEPEDLSEYQEWLKSQREKDIQAEPLRVEVRDTRDKCAKMEENNGKD
ncbi:MAG: hypothetical protein NC548_27170 [Lachnospiraceae bacterium]|nr:hypothetical protein [Lachnospiraceae bacterium]